MSGTWILPLQLVGGQRYYTLCYVPSADEWPLRLQLPNGELSKTNGFISPMWGGVILWNPEDGGETPESKHPVRHKISHQDLQKVLKLSWGSCGNFLVSHLITFFFGSSGASRLLASERGFTLWELDVLSRQHTCFNLHSCATTLGSLSRLVQSLPRMRLESRCIILWRQRNWLKLMPHLELLCFCCCIPASKISGGGCVFSSISYVR